MRDPHVNSLTYKLGSGSHASYKDCPPIEHENANYKLELKDGVLTCNFKTHYSAIEVARVELEKLLKAWGIEAAIKRGRGVLEFKFIEGSLIDRNPPPAGQIELSAKSEAITSGSATANITFSDYPPIPNDFEINPEVETLWHRYELYLDGRDQLLGMGYFCLSFLENIAGGYRGLAVRKYSIERPVLDELGDLTSERGGYETARKGKGHAFVEITDKEKLWIEECIKKIIYRVGEYEKNPGLLPMITMTDLPAL